MKAKPILPPFGPDDLKHTVILKNQSHGGKAVVLQKNRQHLGALIDYKVLRQLLQISGARNFRVCWEYFVWLRKGFREREERERKGFGERGEREREIKREREREREERESVKYFNQIHLCFNFNKFSNYCNSLQV